MKWPLLLFSSLVSLFSCSKPKIDPNLVPQNLYQAKFNTLSGKPFDTSTLKGKKVMIVNTASKCGLTPQYESLEKLYQKYKDQNFVILGFPANNFLSQEPGSNEEIAEFCQLNYGVNFPMMEKISVKGSDQHFLYQYLTLKEFNHQFDAPVSWNFQKFLIGKDEIVEKVFDPQTLPDDPQIIQWIEN